LEWALRDFFVPNRSLKTALARRPAKRRSLTWDRRYDNPLLGQGCRSPRGAVIHGDGCRGKHGKSQ